MWPCGSQSAHAIAPEPRMKHALPTTIGTRDRERDGCESLDFQNVMTPPRWTVRVEQRPCRGAVARFAVFSAPSAAAPMSGDLPCDDLPPSPRLGGAKLL